MHFTMLTVTIPLLMGLYHNNHSYQNLIHADAGATMVDITRQEAEQIATSNMKRAFKDDADMLAVDKSLTKEYPFGWAVIVLPKKYMETRVPDLTLFGIGFFIVTRDGSIEYIPNYISPDLAIDWYTKKWESIHGNDKSKQLR